MPPKRRPSAARGERAKRSRAPALPAAEVAAEWKVWTAENLAWGATRAEIRDALVAEGASTALADRTIDEIEASPAMIVARSLARTVKRDRLVLSLLERSRRIAPTGSRLSRIEWPGGAELIERYLATSTPVIVTGFVAQWPAMTRWTLDALRARFGDATVEMTTGRDADRDYDMHTPQHSQQMTLARFIAMIDEADGPTNDFYMVAQNRNLSRSLRGLLDDVMLPADIVREDALPAGAQLWLGPAGTVTPLHHDTSHALFCQVVGRKRFRLVAPTELRLHDAARAMYAAVDPEAPDLDRFAWWPDVLVRDEVIAPGELLVIPVGWWHHVRALDVSVSLSVNALSFPNRYDDYVPGNV